MPASQKVKKLVLGFVGGVAAGLLLTCWAGVWINGWAFLLLGPFALLVSAAVGVVVGWYALPAARWRAIALTALLGWPLAVCLPLGSKALYLQRIATAHFPVYPGSEKIHSQVEPVAGDRAAFVEWNLEAEAESEDVLRFYRDQIANHGWAAKESILGENPFSWMARARTPAGDLQIKLIENPGVQTESAPTVKITLLYEAR